MGKRKTPRVAARGSVEHHEASKAETLPNKYQPNTLERQDCYWLHVAEDGVEYRYDAKPEHVPSIPVRIWRDPNGHLVEETTTTKREHWTLDLGWHEVCVLPPGEGWTEAWDGWEDDWGIRLWSRPARKGGQ